jgi:ATP-dependent Clp protease protease subunit
MDKSVPGITVPTIIREKGYSLDIYSYLAMERILVLEETTEESANRIIAQLLYLSHKDPNRDISLYINHGGGNSYAGMALIDTMETINCDVSTVSVGFSASMGAIILCAGAKGKRYALPNSTIMMHQARFQSEIYGEASDIKIQADEINRLEDRINRLLSDRTGQPLEKIITDTMRDFYLNAEEALKYGIVDKILVPNREKKY